MNRRDRRRAEAQRRRAHANEQRAISIIEDTHGKPLKVALAIKGRLLISNPPPRAVLMSAIKNTLQNYPNGLAESIIEFEGGRQILYLIGPRQGDTVPVDVWNRAEIDAMYKRAGKTFFSGEAPERATTTGVYPAWVFDRHPEIEHESNLLLAGDLIIDLPADPEGWSPAQRETLKAIHLRLLLAARAGEMPEDSIVYGWPGGEKPANAVDVDNHALMDAWMSERTFIVLRFTEHAADEFLRQPDSVTLQHLGMLQRMNRRGMGEFKYFGPLELPGDDEPPGDTVPISTDDPLAPKSHEEREMSKIITDDPELRHLHDNIDDDVRRDGRSVLCIGAEDDSPPFAYTIGNALVGLPELLIIGTLEGGLLNDLSRIMLERGRAFDDGELVNLGGKFPVKIITADVGRAQHDYTIQAGQYLGVEDYPVLQVLVPDRNGRYPDDAECQRPYANMPVLGHRRH
jgi:hypothetical protein